jgi:phosphohistidine phosphatase
LTERGRRDGALVAQALAEAGFAPDLALVSQAARADQTWLAAAPAFPEAKALILRALYNAEPEAILALVEAKGAASGTVMVVAHNPGLHQLSLMLAQRCEESLDRTRLSAGFPTGAAAAFDLGAGRFFLLTPKQLGGGA